MKYDVIIIGSGPAGYVAAIRAGQVGLKTAIVEKENIGGMCLNWGCIPSKAMIESAKLFNRINIDAARFGIEGIDKKNISFNYAKAAKRANAVVSRLTKGIEFLLKKNGVEIISGEAKITSDSTVTVGNRSMEADKIIIATGSAFPDTETVKNDLIVDIKNLFSDREIPENIVVAGENSVAIELAQFFSLTRKNVTLAVPSNIIMPLADEYLANYMLGILKKNKINIVYNSAIESFDKAYTDGELLLNETKVKCDLFINGTKRNAVLPAMDIELELDNDFIKTDDDCLTSIPNIYAVGDVNGKSTFAHIGSAQGLHVIDQIKGIKSKLDLKKYPLNMYTVPEVAQIGSTEAEIKKMDIEYKISEFPLSANGKAMTEGTNEGFVRILSETKYGEVLGVQIVAPHATDLIAEASAYMQLEATIYDVAKTVHAHPTISEVFMEAGFEAVDKAIHK